MLFSFIIFLLIGVVSAQENTTSNDNIKDIIDTDEDGIVELDEKTYYLTPEKETHITLNRSIAIEGKGENTIIDGNGSSLYFDVEKTEINKSEPIVVVFDPYDIEDKGKHITFKNITFKDLNLNSRHEMEFIDCKFIRSNFTSKELNNTFVSCIFEDSNVELSVYDSYEYRYYAKLINCTLYNSKVSSKTYIFIQIDGSDRVYISNGIDMINLKIFNSDISLNHYNVNISNSVFDNSSFRGSSDKINVFNSSFHQFKSKIHYSDVAFEQTTFNALNIGFVGGYYSKGCEVSMKNCILNGTSIMFNPNHYSGRSKLTIQNSSVDNCDIKPTETDIEITDSTFNKTRFELFLSGLDMDSSIFYGTGSVNDTIKTITYIEQVAFDDYGNMTVFNETYPMITNYTAKESYFINGSGEFKINTEELNVNTSYHITYDRNRIYYINDNITFKLTDSNGNPISNKLLYIENQDDYAIGLITDENGIANYTIDKAGELNIKVYLRFGFYPYPEIDPEVINLTVHSMDVKVIENFKYNRYSNIKSFIDIKLTSSDLSNHSVLFKVYTGKKYATYQKTTNSDGAVHFKIPEKLDVGVHKIQVIVDNKITKTTSIKIYQAKTIVKAPKISVKLKKSKYFKVTVKNKETKKMISNVKVKVKIFTGKKYKTYTVKTNKKGIAKINTKQLKIGKHKVIISSGNKNYDISGKSLIKIK